MKINKGFIFLIIITSLICSCNKSDAQKQADADNKDANIIGNSEHDDKNRHITVIVNLPEKYSKKVTLYTNKYVQIGVIREDERENIPFPGDNNKIKENLEKYNDETNFIIILEDRYGLIYKEEFTAQKTGNSKVIIDNSCYVKHPGDWKRKAARFLNREW